MQATSFEEVLEIIVEKDPRYRRDAYHFLREALDYTQKTLVKDTKSQPRHITGQELLGGLRDYALEQFGPMAITVLEEWGIRTCEDFGEIVFNMVDNSLLAKTDQDNRTDFQNGYDFHSAFRKPYLPQEKPQTTLPESKEAKS